MKPVGVVGAPLQGLMSMLKISVLRVVRSHWNGFYAEDRHPWICFPRPLSWPTGELTRDRSRWMYVTQQLEVAANVLGSMTVVAQRVMVVWRGAHVERLVNINKRQHFFTAHCLRASYHDLMRFFHSRSKTHVNKAL